jgi:hypothetical protein
MATYKGIQGYTVDNLSSDPPAAQSVGQLWYNSTSGTFKIGTQSAGAWSAGGDLNTGRDWMAWIRNSNCCNLLRRRTTCKCWSRHSC